MERGTYNALVCVKTDKLCGLKQLYKCLPRVVLSRYHIQCTLSLTHCTSLVPRPHPLTRRNSLVNQVEFLGLAQTFATVSPSNVQNFLHQTHSKKRYSSRFKIFTIVREVLSNNYRSHNLIAHYHYWGISPRNLTLFTRPFLAGRHMWEGHETSTVHAGYQDGSSNLVYEIKVT